MGVHKTVFSLVLFYSLFTVLMAFGTVTAATFQNGYSLLNQTNTNFTGVNTGISNVQICNYHGDIPILSGLIWGADCIASGVGLMLSFSSVNSSIAVLGSVFLAGTVVFILLIVMILRGNAVV